MIRDYEEWPVYHDREPKLYGGGFVTYPDLPMDITLTGAEMLEAGVSGVCRSVNSIKNPKVNEARGVNNQLSGWQIDIEGALGERAAAKALGMYCRGSGKIKGLDVGNEKMGVDVRTRRDHWMDLIIYEDDYRDRIFYLVTGSRGEYTIRGWILGEDAMREEWRQDPAGEKYGRISSGGYFVKQEFLNTHEPELFSEGARTARALRDARSRHEIGHRDVDDQAYWEG